MSKISNKELDLKLTEQVVTGGGTKNILNNHLTDNSAHKDLFDNKSDKTHIHDIATTSSNGFMSTSDKTKLNGIENNANKTIIENNLISTSTTAGLSAYQGKILNDKIIKSPYYSLTLLKNIIFNSDNVNSNTIIPATFDYSYSEKSLTNNIFPLNYHSIIGNSKNIYKTDDLSIYVYNSRTRFIYNNMIIQMEPGFTYSPVLTNTQKLNIIPTINSQCDEKFSTGHKTDYVFRINHNLSSNCLYLINLKGNIGINAYCNTAFKITNDYEYCYYSGMFTQSNTFALFFTTVNSSIVNIKIESMYAQSTFDLEYIKLYKVNIVH